METSKEYFLIAALIIVTIFLFYLYTYEAIKKDRFINKLHQDGFEYIFYGKSVSFIAFNIIEGKFRLGKLDDNFFVERPVNFISNYEWKWIEKDAIKTSNRFVFYISDVNYFMHEIFYHRDERLAEIEWAKFQAVYQKAISQAYISGNQIDRQFQYDFFISHASEDKNSFVRPLFESLSKFGLKVWYDEMSLEVGDSLRQSIDQGLKKSRYGIVVLSHAFFSKKWTQYELDALVSKSMCENDKVILPIWHGLEHKDIASYSHNLADKLAFSSSQLSVDSMASAFLKVAQERRV